MKASHCDLVLVFDMGGVLFDFQGAGLIARSSRRAQTPEHVRTTWVPLVRSFEVGACSEAEFAERAVAEYELTLQPAAFIAAFRAAAVGFYDGALALIRELRDRHRVVSLSNTNAVQWPEVLAQLGPIDPFHAHYPSHVSGFHKPDPRAYQAVARAHVASSLFYFFDDRPDNVAAAAQLGWETKLVRGIAETAQACTDFGLL